MKLQIGAEDKWLSFSRCDLQPVFQSIHSPGFTPAVQLYCLNSNLPSLQQCLQHWEVAALEATRVTLAVPCQDPLARAEEFGLGEPHQPPPPACWQRGLWEGSEGSTAQQSSRESLQQLPWCLLSRREGQQPMGMRALWSHGPDPSPCVWNGHGTPALRAPALPTQQELTATGKARTSTPQKWGSREFIAQSTL